MNMNSFGTVRQSNYLCFDLDDWVWYLLGDWDSEAGETRPLSTLVGFRSFENGTFQSPSNMRLMDVQSLPPFAATLTFSCILNFFPL